MTIKFNSIGSSSAVNITFVKKKKVKKPYVKRIKVESKLQ